MAKARLKVYRTQIGFYDTVVATPNQSAALRAWGVHQNLFASGDAMVTDEKDVIAQALRHPETPLRRAVGASGAFELEPTTPPKPPKSKAKPKAAKAAPTKTRKEQPPPIVDRSTPPRRTFALWRRRAPNKKRNCVAARKRCTMR